MNWSEQVVLVTGGTGSFGRKFAEMMLREHNPRKLIIFSSNGLKQKQMRASGFNHPSVEYLTGDVRDPQSLERAVEGITIAVHAAGLKHVPACESEPWKAIQTNVIGAHHLIEAAIRHGVRRVLAVSTDKAANPGNLYGATKFCAERMFVQANRLPQARETRFSCSRYGNVLGSDGSVISMFVEQRKEGKIRVTDPRMTRFCITPEQAVRFVIRCLETMEGGEIFVRKSPSMRPLDLASALAPDCQVEYIGLRPGEKLHEVLVTENEARYTLEMGDMYVIQPSSPRGVANNPKSGRHLPESFHYSSDNNSEWLTLRELEELVAVHTSVPKRRIGSFFRRCPAKEFRNAI